VKLPLALPAFHFISFRAWQSVRVFGVVVVPVLIKYLLFQRDITK
jgi:hypothetical protein